MIMGGDKKKMASIIVEKFGAPKEDKMKANNEKAFGELAAEPAPEVDEGLLSGAEEIMGAVNGKDPARLAQALKDFLAMCDEPEAAEPEAEPSAILG